MKPIHEIFAVGRLSKNDRRMIIVERAAPPPPPIQGPWEVRAVFAR